MAKSLRKQANAYLKKFIAYGQRRHTAKRADHSAAGYHSVRAYNDAVDALAHAASDMKVTKITQITDTMANLYLLMRLRSNLSTKAIGRDRSVLARVAGRKLLSTPQLHQLSSQPHLTNALLKAEQRGGNLYRDTVLLKVIGRLSSDPTLLAAKQHPTGTPLASPSASRPNDNRRLKDISRVYTDEVIAKIANAMPLESARLATILCRDAGLRAHEVLTLRRTGEGEQVAKSRDWRSDRHAMRNEAVEYLVTGKGGLVRTVKISAPLAGRLEKLRLDKPRDVWDRKTLYKQRYDLIGGNRLSQRFTRASKKLTGKSLGLHGLRHTYAHSRFYFLVQNGLEMNNAKHIVSQELGHKRMKITDEYLR